MNEYLRDFINENVSIDCGGNKGLTSPESIQDKINEILNRLDRLEAGLGMTITIQDQLALTFFELTGLLPGDNIIGGPRITPATPMPESGTVTRVTCIGNIISDPIPPNTKADMQFSVIRGGSETVYEIETTPKNGPFSVTMSIPVLGDDYFAFKAVRTGIQYSVIPCHAYLQLPARTYQVER